jgi:GTP cyclohydrolase IA
MSFNGNGSSLLETKHFNGNGQHSNNGHQATNGKQTKSLAEIEELGDAHLGSSIDTPLRADAFVVTDERKIDLIESHFAKIMQTLGLDMRDDSLRGTPRRVAKMFVQEIFSGLNPDNAPAISVFDNKFRYGQMLVEKNIHVSSTCEHHFLPIFGKAHIAYIPTDKVIGLSKLNRIVDFYARRPQVQERLTVQIANHLKKALKTDDVAVVIDARHMCVMSRGIKDIDSSTITAEYSGKFNNEHYRSEFLRYIE